jgi:glycosyltransferase involved in cell wall biosynthesis
MSPLISIIIPLYNKEKYFERCFISVTKQTYKNIECIIVEDVSTDNSLKLAEQLIQNYTGGIKFLLIKHENNGGLSAARNTGINNSSGEYVYFLDSDDEITDNCIKSLVMLVIKYPGVDIVQGNLYQYPRVENDIYDIKGKLPEFAGGNLKIKKKYYEHLPVNSVNKLIRRYFITQNNLYFKAGLVHEDNHWLFFAIKKIESFAFTGEYCYIRYYVPDSIMTNPNLLPSISSYLTICEDKLNNLDVDLLKEQLYDVRQSLYGLKDTILSEKNYLFLLPKCKILLARIPNGLFYLSFALHEAGHKIKQAIKTIIRFILGKKLSAKIKHSLKK